MAYIRKVASGRWQASIRRRGHSLSKTFATKANAEAWARKTESDLEHGQLFKSTTMTVSDLLERYEREVTEHKKGKSQEASRLRLLASELGKHSLGDLTAEICSRWAKSRLASVSSDTVRRDLAVLSAAIETGRVLWEIEIKGNAARTALSSLTKSRAMKRPNRRVRRVSDEELSAILAELGPVMRNMVLFDLETAMRRGEVARMEWEHLAGNRLLIPDDKTGKSQFIPLSSRAMEILEGVQPEPEKRHGSVFGMKPDSITQAFDRACERAGIQDLRFHDIRHEATSRLFERGLSIEEVATITRHSDWRSLKIYTHPSLDHISSKLG